MQLKHTGNKVTAMLTKPEQRVMAKTYYLLETISLLPCDGQESAKVAVEAIDTLLGPMTKADPEEADDKAVESSTAESE